MASYPGYCLTTAAYRVLAVHVGCVVVGNKLDLILGLQECFLARATNFCPQIWSSSFITSFIKNDSNNKKGKNGSSRFCIRSRS
jgi:hypothetical protein